MRKTLLLLLLVLVFLISFGCGGCRKRQLNPEEIVDKLKDLKSYSCDINIKVKNSREILEYSGRELYCRGAGYKVELGEERVFLYKGDKIYVEDLKNGTKYVLNGDFDQVFKYSFIGDYIGLLYSNEKIIYTTLTETGVNYLGIGLVLPGNNRNLSSAILYIEEKTAVPKRVLIFDNRNRETIEIEYWNFKVMDLINGQWTMDDGQLNSMDNG